MLEELTSAGAISKFLRSKNVSTLQIYDVAQHLLNDNVEVHFPNKEVFILELIVDRWNDQKNIEFKTNHRIWALFNEGWVSINDDEHRKKIFKHLRYVPQLLQTLELIEGNYDGFAAVLSENFKLLNSCLVVDMNADQAFKVMGRVLRIAVNVSSELGNDLAGQALELTQMRNNYEVSGKNSASFCENALLGILLYNANVPDGDEGSLSSQLSSLVGQYVFGPETDSMKHLSRFLSTNDQQLSDEALKTLFRIAIKFLSRDSLSQLESLLSTIIHRRSSIASALLQDLCSLKRTLSQQFLEDLFTDVFQKLVDSGMDSLWTLIIQILKLDIEVGIINTNKIMHEIAKTKSLSENCLLAWDTLIECYVNAREFPRFLSLWQEYVLGSENSKCFVDNVALSSKITTHVPAMSATQLREFLTNIIGELIKNSNQGDTIIKMLNTVVRAFYLLPHALLPEMEPVLFDAFETKRKDSSQYWTFVYHFMNIYDDIFPEERLVEIEKMIMSSLKLGIKSNDLILAVLKLRELKELNLQSLVKDFLIFWRQIPLPDQRNILEELFCRWSTVINSSFGQEELRELVTLLLKTTNISLLDQIMKSDDIFEEDNIMRTLINEMYSNIQDEAVVRYFTQIPIQCIAKSMRVKLINALSNKPTVSYNDLQLLSHLLLNPTFKSEIETIPRASYAIVQKCGLFDTGNSAFETNCGNHISQIKDPLSEEYISKLLDLLNEGLAGHFDLVVCKMGFLLLRVGKYDVTLFGGLENALVKSLTDMILAVPRLIDGSDEVHWALGALYEIYQQSRTVQTKEHIVAFTKMLQKSISSDTLSENLAVSVFSLFCCTYNDQPAYMLAHYVVLRERVESSMIYPALDQLIKDSASHYKRFNEIFYSLLLCFKDLGGFSACSIFEIWGLMIQNIQKENLYGRKLFVQSLSEMFTNINKVASEEKLVLVDTINIIKGLLVTKPWLFTQHSIENLFPMCFKLNTLSIKPGAPHNNEVFSSTSQLLSHALMYHRYKFSNRHHLIIAYLCATLEMFTTDSHLALSQDATRTFGRLVTVLCEPSSGSKSTRNTGSLNSQVSQVKKSLRKHLPVLLLKYINLAVNSSFNPKVKEELVLDLFSVFDVLSPTELTFTNACLDGAGRIYFRTLYSEYKRTGKWKED